ncbi:hypothetical protein WA026_016474 [Henosepilachna vigintioctopunctata]|uniref:Uncharacterized protein n=1 Tax=Henosepilachna vigintioctopunctata TaxID=420089 RepID=A0AAW1UFY2_9CUCU
MPSKKQYDLVQNDDYDTRIPLHSEEAFHRGITFQAKLRNSPACLQHPKAVEPIGRRQLVRVKSIFSYVKLTVMMEQLRQLGCNRFYINIINTLQDYDRNNDFVGNTEYEIPQNDLVYTVEWPTDHLYSSVTSKSILSELDIVDMNMYFLEAYNDNDDFKIMTEIMILLEITTEYEIPQNDLVYTVEWPTDHLYSSVTSKSILPELDIVDMNMYFLEAYNDNDGMIERAQKGL